MRDLLLEIGCEELPARFIPGVLEQLKERARELLTESRITFGTVSSYGTPRRLALVVEDVAEKQADLEEEIKGPPARVAFDADGAPTKAALGFAKNQGLAPEELVVKSTPGGDYVYAVLRQTGAATEELLPSILEQIIAQLGFPKSMRWATKERFARPIRWLLALYGDRVLQIQYAGVQSGNNSYGHRFLHPGPVEIPEPKAYRKALKGAWVVVDQEERKELIKTQIDQLGKQVGGTVVAADGLLEEIVHLVEFPTALCGSFDPAYLALPEEVLITPMQEHQRYFALRDQQGKLLPKFIAVHNGSEAHLDVITRGNERVLKARLDDARFFYDEDRKRSLRSRVEELKKVVFQEKLGTIYEKMERTRALVDYLAGKVGLDEESKASALEAAYLAKADLVTNMVGEFPELQGVMGREYALQDGEPKAVAVAIYEHYLPRFADDHLPQTLPGAIVGIADRMDTIVGCFGVGLRPTGSQDPYALRRQAAAILTIILEHDLPVDLLELIQRSYALYAETQTFAAEVPGEVAEFFQARFQRILEEVYGLPYDVVDAVLAQGVGPVRDVLARGVVLHEALQGGELAPLLKAHERVTNLAAKATGSKVDPSLFVEAAEKELYEVFSRVAVEVEEHLANGAYQKVVQSLLQLTRPVDRFFDEVLVMAEDEAVRQNRLGLLAALSAVLSTLGNLKAIRAS
ncbi:MAG TPA: glycine--tRNA ligase subunit beta [Firmicutes bacterium]|nr:glycine--tRNA ligase subunit beta [Bacillota bacterium]